MLIYVMSTYGTSTKFDVCKIFKKEEINVLFEPTCANARWALMSHFLSVCPPVCD